MPKRSWWTSAALTVGAVASAGVVTTAGPAQAATAGAQTTRPATAPSIQSFRNVATGRCLEGWIETIVTSSCRNDNSQRFRVTAVPNYRILNDVEFPRECMDDSRNGVQELDCNGTDFQKFFILHYSDGSIAFRNKATNNCIYDSGRYNGSTYIVYAARCTGSTAQRWK